MQEKVFGVGTLKLGNIFLSDSQNIAPGAAFYLVLTQAVVVPSQRPEALFSLTPFAALSDPSNSHSSNHWPPAFLEQTNATSASGTLHSLFPSRGLFLQIFTGSLLISFGVWLRCQFQIFPCQCCTSHPSSSILIPYSHSAQNIPLKTLCNFKFYLLCLPFPIRNGI